MGMIRPKRAFPEFQALLMQVFCFRVTAAFVQQVRKIVHCRQAIKMFGSQYPLPLREALAKEILGSRIVSPLLEHQSFFLHAIRSLGSG